MNTDITWGEFIGILTGIKIFEISGFIMDTIDFHPGKVVFHEYCNPKFNSIEINQKDVQVLRVAHFTNEQIVISGDPSYIFVSGRTIGPYYIHPYAYLSDCRTVLNIDNQSPHFYVAPTPYCADIPVPPCTRKLNYD